MDEVGKSAFFLDCFQFRTLIKNERKLTMNYSWDMVGRMVPYLLQVFSLAHGEQTSFLYSSSDSGDAKMSV